jgi:hypothetical protein
MHLRDGRVCQQSLKHHASHESGGAGQQHLALIDRRGQGVRFLSSGAWHDGRCQAFARSILECAIKGVGILEAEEEGDLAAGHLRIPQIVAGQAFSRGVDQSAKVFALVFKATLQRTLAHAQTLCSVSMVAVLLGSSSNRTARTRPPLPLLRRVR